VARTAAFDPDDARRRALLVFWRKGYTGASLRDLLRAMRLSESSFYNTFRSKHELFLSTLDLYSNVVQQELEAELAAEPARGAVALRRLIEKILSVTDGKGCYFGNCAAEVAAHDKLAASRIGAGLRRLEVLFARAVRDTIEPNGDSARTADKAALLVAQVQGLLILGKAGVPKARLLALADQALESLLK
jgi:TetR/AcrR family transcriptional repressor of nem operon